MRPVIRCDTKGLSIPGLFGSPRLVSCFGPLLLFSSTPPVAAPSNSGYTCAELSRSKSPAYSGPTHSLLSAQPPAIFSVAEYLDCGRRVLWCVWPAHVWHDS
ncbi:hypothetical protein OE88DRAFT_1667348 [Heliocybe sulcata]|uniref:Uncharacterized protein n=1 Tax=Heliocybe sulcata TaxID=5364 RepID=A0A5C3MN37_9AGAM|nr:hypothetical protein OE88DRAFT_1667348 [Heliocybe sulcata]